MKPPLRNSASTAATAPPALKVESAARASGIGGVRVCNLNSDAVASLGKCAPGDDLLRSTLRVTVAQASLPADDELPDVFGRYQVLEDGLRFIPHFPFDKGTKYRASFDPQSLGDLQPSGALTLEFSLPEEWNIRPTEVRQVFPSSDSLPENLLRFYVCFSGSMQRGRVEEQIAILDPDGCPAPDVLYHAPVELWDRSMRHLTILLDPGRLKRGVGPNVELGPPLKVGQEYALVIGSGMVDLSGQPLQESFYKRFRVTEAVRKPIATEQWKVLRPLAGSRQPLVLMFRGSLDWAMLLHAIAVQSVGGLAIDGRIAVDCREGRWSFTPTSPWAAGGYRVRVESGLEDVCGNTVVAAFDRPLRSISEPAHGVTNQPIVFQLE